MRGLLLGTTAVVAASLALPGAAAERISLQLGGFMSDWVGYAANETDKGAGEYRKAGLMTDTEIHVLGSTTLDNGLQFSVNIELEADGEDTAGTVDESWMEMSSPGFGALRAGYDDLVTGLVHNAAPNYGPGFDFAETWLPGRGTVAQGFTDAYSVVGFGDEAKITYLTPRFLGFQLGASYVPRMSDRIASGDGPGNGSLKRFAANSVADGPDGYGIALTYSEKFGDFGVSADIGYARASGGLDDNVRSADGNQVGVLLTYDAFEFGGGWQSTNEQHGARGAGLAAPNEGSTWEVGLGYKPGPWGLSASYLRAAYTNDIANPGNDTAKIFAMSGVYNLGPGVDVNGSLYWSRYESETGTDAAFNRGGWALVAGVMLAF